MVAAGIVPAAHATDGGGSIRIPASCCGLFGLKPSRARVSMAPDKGEGWAGFSCGHAVSRSVRDSAVLLDIAAGPEKGDPYCAPPKARPYSEEVGTPPGVLKIAVTTDAFNAAEVDKECRQAVELTAQLCVDLGHRVDETRPVISTERLREVTGLIVGVNVRATLEDRAKALGRELEEDDVEPITWTMAKHAKRWSATDYVRAVSGAHRLGATIANFFAAYDVLLSPTMASLPPRLGELALTREDRGAYMECVGRTIGFTQMMNVAGNPAMSVPLHWSEQGLPVGVQFASAFGDEATLFRLAAQLEEARPWFDRRAI